MPNSFLLGHLKYTQGNATIPHASDNRVIINVLDLNGRFDSAFNEAVSKRWVKAKNDYKVWYNSQNKFKLGEYQLVQVQSDTAIANILALENKEINFDALTTGMINLGKEAALSKSNIHIPELNYDKDKLEKLLKDAFLIKAVNVTIYEP